MSGDQASAFKQIEIYLGRCWRGFVNDKGWKVFISVVLITAIIGLVLGDDTFERYADTKNGFGSVSSIPSARSAASAIS